MRVGTDAMGQEHYFWFSFVLNIFVKGPHCYGKNDTHHIKVKLYVRK